MVFTLQGPMSHWQVITVTLASIWAKKKKEKEKPFSSVNAKGPSFPELNWTETGTHQPSKQLSSLVLKEQWEACKALIWAEETKTSVSSPVPTKKEHEEASTRNKKQKTKKVYRCVIGLGPSSTFQQEKLHQLDKTNVTGFVWIRADFLLFTLLETWTRSKTLD